MLSSVVGYCFTEFNVGQFLRDVVLICWAILQNNVFTWNNPWRVFRWTERSCKFDKFCELSNFLMNKNLIRCMTCLFIYSLLVSSFSSSCCHWGILLPVFLVLHFFFQMHITLHQFRLILWCSGLFKIFQLSVCVSSVLVCYLFRVIFLLRDQKLQGCHVCYMCLCNCYQKYEGDSTV